MWFAVTAALVLQVGVTHLGTLQNLFDITSISGTRWLVCVAVASSVVAVEEIRKLFCPAVEARRERNPR